MNDIKQRLWIVSELFPPEETSTAYIMGEIANSLAAKYDVRVICGPEIYDKEKGQDINNRFKLNDSITVIRSEIRDFDKNSFFGKLFRYVLLSAKMYKSVSQNVRVGDKLLMVTNPAPLVALVSCLRKSVDFEFILLVHDIFPENTKPAGIRLPAFLFSAIKKIFDKAYSRADRMIALGRDMKEVLVSKIKPFSANPKIAVIENWADLDSIRPIKKESSKCISIQYAGNIGKVQGLQQFVSLMQSVENPLLRFDLWGTGAAEKGLKEYVANHQISNVFFHGPYFRSQQNEILNDCTLSLVTLSEGMLGLGVPSKTYNILAAGRPVLYIGDGNSEIGMLVKENRIGFSFTPNEYDAMTGFLNDLSADSIEELETMGANARRLAEERYSKDVILERITDFVS